MRLTSYTDYALRVLMYAAMRKDRLSRIDDIAESFGISRNHLMKVVHQLGHHGYIETIRGRAGGLRLAQRPENIKVGDVVRTFETDLTLVECFDPNRSTCPIASVCVLRRALHEALGVFLARLDETNLADLVKPARRLKRLLA